MSISSLDTLNAASIIVVGKEKALAAYQDLIDLKPVLVQVSARKYAIFTGQGKVFASQAGTIIREASV